MLRSYRAFVVVLLSLLLFGAQQEALRHALTHWTAALSADQKQSLRADANAPCVECALLAAGADVLADTAQLPAAPAVAWVATTWTPSAAALAAPVYYLSRAPPSSL